MSPGANTPRRTAAVGSTSPGGFASSRPTSPGWAICTKPSSPSMITSSTGSYAASRTLPPPGSGRPLLPTLVPETLASTASPSVVAKNSTTCAGSNFSVTRRHRPAGMPEPMNSRTG
ncbi:Uncharacterised protein [Mycobacteroides abscessus subsp. abscessus]|nr:Uncharacterised protein [Mycobacteroides abscessus subsp. abscessus]